MAATTNAGLSEAEKRTISIVNEYNEPVIFDGNLAELPGARYEVDRCLDRIGAFQLLIQHNACRVGGTSGVIATEDVNTVAFVSELCPDPDINNYTYRTPCPDTATRIANVNAARVIAGQPAFTGIPNLLAIPANILKTTVVNKYEVAIEDHAYALTRNQT